MTNLDTFRDWCQDQFSKSLVYGMDSDDPERRRASSEAVSDLSTTLRVLEVYKATEAVSAFKAP